MIKAYLTTITGTLNGQIYEEHRGNRGIEAFPIHGNPQDFPEDYSGFQFGRMDLDSLNSSVTIIRFISPENNNMMPIAHRKHYLNYWVMGRTEEECESAKSKLEKIFGIELDDEEEEIPALERHNSEINRITP